MTELTIEEYKEKYFKGYCEDCDHWSTFSEDIMDPVEDGKCALNPKLYPYKHGWCERWEEAK